MLVHCCYDECVVEAEVFATDSTALIGTCIMVSVAYAHHSRDNELANRRKFCDIVCLFQSLNWIECTLLRLQAPAEANGSDWGRNDPIRRQPDQD
jgi:hypothetical protein